MQTITLYRYIRPDGGVTVSPVKPECDHTEMFRLVADEGMILADGANEAACIDTDTPGVWSEIVGPELGRTYTETDESVDVETESIN